MVKMVTYNLLYSKSSNRKHVSNGGIVKKGRYNSDEKDEN